MSHRSAFARKSTQTTYALRKEEREQAKRGRCRGRRAPAVDTPPEPMSAPHPTGKPEKDTVRWLTVHDDEERASSYHSRHMPPDASVAS